MMSYARNYDMKGGTTREDYRSSRINSFGSNFYRNRNTSHYGNYDNFHADSRESRNPASSSNFEHMRPNGAPSMKRRKYSSSMWGAYDNVSFARDNRVFLPSRVNADAPTSISGKRDRSQLEDDEVLFMSREEIDRISPSRKDGIDAPREAQLRYSYCAFLQDLGVRLELPQTTIGTAMVLCHRFFVRRSHACHDRFLIATAILFLAAKSEETPRPLNNVLRASCEIFHKQDISFLSYLLPVDWFEQYRERVIEAEQLILTTLNFELNVQHPYAPLTSTLSKLGLSQGVLLNLALNLISEGIYTRLGCSFLMIIFARGLMCCSWKVLFSTGLPVYSDLLYHEHILSSLSSFVEDYFMICETSCQCKHISTLRNGKLFMISLQTIFSYWIIIVKTSYTKNIVPKLSIGSFSAGLDSRFSLSKDFLSL